MGVRVFDDDHESDDGQNDHKKNKNENDVDNNNNKNSTSSSNTTTTKILLHLYMEGLANYHDATRAYTPCKFPRLFFQPSYLISLLSTALSPPPLSLTRRGAA